MKILNKKLTGKSFLVIVTLVALLFFLFGLMLALTNLRSLTSTRSGFSLSSSLIFAIGIYFMYTITKSYIKFYKLSIKNPYKTVNDFYKNNKISIIITATVSIILLFIYYNGIYHDFNFILQVIILLPVFIFQNFLPAVQVYARTVLNLTFLSPIFDLILPIAQVYYIFHVARFVVNRFAKPKP